MSALAWLNDLYVRLLDAVGLREEPWVIAYVLLWVGTIGGALWGIYKAALAAVQWGLE